jgi:serine/threonine-protein kinase
MYPQVFGKYVLERELARGGMARVVLATLRGAGGFEKRLVVKQIRDELASDAEFVRRFVDEAKTTVALSHPNIVPVYELGVEQGTYYLAMELVDGVSISELLADGALSPEEGAYVGVEVCRALDYAHRRMNVVHRDVTPRNVMVDEEGQVKLIDFGIASMARLGSSEQQVFGSPGHMPPEQMAGTKVGPAADIFATAALLLEAWSTKAPFRRKTTEEIEAALAAPHPKPSAADIRLLPIDEIIAKCTLVDPAARLDSAEELGRALRKFLAGIDLGDVARGLGDRVRRVRDRATERMKEAPSSLPRARAASVGDIVTKTFAARDEVGSWSERPPPADVGPSTRKVLSTAPPPDSGDERTEPETIATRPIETPAKVAPPAKPRDPPRLGLIIGGAIAVVLGFLAWRGSQPTTTTTPSVASTALPTTSTAAPPVTASAPPSATTTTTAPPPTSVATAATDSSAAVTTAKAHLVLLGDLGTRASIDGRAAGACPVNDFVVDPGDHDVRFTFDATGESAGTRLHVNAGEKVTLTGDFAGATPTVHQHR